MDVVAAVLPSLVVAVAFVAILVAVFRHTDRSDESRRTDHDQRD
jgi:hypothetical protein